jgi:hypothetical protein
LRPADLGVIGFKKNFQVLYAVVVSIIVYVVHLFLCTEASSKFALHQMTMNLHTSPVRSSHSQVVDSSITSLRMREFTCITAKLSSVFSSVRAYRVFFFAVKACDYYGMATEWVHTCFNDFLVVFTAGKEYSSASVRTSLAFIDHKRPSYNRLAADGARLGRFGHAINVLRGLD